MNYQEFIQPFYNSETKTSGLRGVQSQGETAEYFVDLAFAHEIPEKYISQPDTYRRWYTGRSNPKSTLWKEIEKAFDDKRFEEYSKELAAKIDDEKLIDLLLAYDIKLALGKKANKKYFAEALTYQFKAIANGKGSADEIVKQTYYSKEKPAVFGEYIRKAKETYSRMTVLGGKECLLDDCYVCNYIGTKRGVFLRNKNGLIIDATLEKLKTFDRRAETKNTLLIANGGMGKSLMLQHLFVDAAEKYSETGLLPIFIELREFSFDQVELFNIIVETVKNMDESFTPEHAHQMLTAGRCQLLLDGVDEIDPQDINSFQRKLSNFLKRYPDNQVVMTSRDCDAYSGIKGFVHLYLLPFDKSQSEELVGRLLIEDDPEAKKTVRECIDDNFIKKDGAFVSNPMMLTFVVERHSTLQNLRAKRYLFYKEAYEAIVLDHDKDKTAYERIFRSVSDSEEFTTVFQEFCAVTFRQGIFSFDSDTFKIYFEELESKKSVENPKKLRAQSFLHDVCATACMMYEEDTDILYIDPGFQEYLFARYYAFATSNEMKELCNTLIDQSTTTFRRWSAFRMLYEYSSDKVEVCLFIPFLDRIFKDRDDRDSFLQFIKIGYKELRYTVLDQDLIENYKGEAGVMNQMNTGELNEPKTVILSVILRVLKQFNFVQIVMYSLKLKYEKLVQKVLLGEYVGAHFGEKSGSKLLLRQYLYSEFCMPTFSETHDISRCVKDQSGNCICFGNEYLISTEQIQTNSDAYQDLIEELSNPDNSLYRLYEIVKNYYLQIKDKQKSNKFK